MAIKLTDEQMDELLKSINDTPAEIETLPGLHGKWEETLTLTRCSLCGCRALYDLRGYYEKSRFCPHCGARMDL